MRAIFRGVVLCISSVAIAVGVTRLDRRGAGDLRPVASVFASAPIKYSLTTPHELAALAHEAGAKFAIEPELILAVMHVESRGNPRARSPRGAIGPMQLMPKTASWLGVTDPYHLRENIHGGAKYLAHLLAEFKGNRDLAIAAYNAGPMAVKRYASVPPYAETRNYLKRVKSTYRELRRQSVES